MMNKKVIFWVSVAPNHAMVRGMNTTMGTYEPTSVNGRKNAAMPGNVAM